LLIEVTSCSQDTHNPLLTEKTCQTTARFTFFIKGIGMLKLLAIALGFTLAGCATPDKFAQSRRAIPETVCCADYSKMNFTLLTVGTTTTTEISTESPAFDFPEGRVRFSAFQVNQLSQSVRLRIRTSMIGNYEGGIFLMYPAIVFLDSSFKPINTALPNLYHIKQNPIITFEAPSWEGFVQLPLNTFYLVLFSPRSKIDTYSNYTTDPNNDPSRTQTRVLVIGSVPVAVRETLGASRVPFGASGQVALELVLN
jgi:hypothetical protein